MSTLLELTAVADSLVLSPLAGADDDALMRIQSELAGVGRRVALAAAEVAAEIAKRSTRDLGYSGLAQRTGARTPEKLVQRLTGSSIRDARALVEAGRMLDASEASGRSPDAVEPVLAAALRTGGLTIEQVRAIDTGLGRPSDAVPDHLLDPARTVLVDLAPSVSVEDLRGHARVLRDELDAAGVADRERGLEDRRYLKLYPQEDGMTRLVALLDPVPAARLQAIVDAALSPRRAGPRFVDPDEKERAERLLDDPRSNDQIALDTVVELLDTAAGSPDASRLLGHNGAPVHVLVAQKDLAEGAGYARIPGQENALSLGKAEHAICTDGATPVFFGRGGDSLRLGRTRRRFSRKQHFALVARDGGCRVCGRSPSQCEAHHILAWSQDGPTDIDNAILLCRFHHLLFHNNHWRIERDPAGQYWFTPPPDVDTLQRAIPAREPDPVVRRLAG